MTLDSQHFQAELKNALKSLVPVDILAENSVGAERAWSEGYAARKCPICDKRDWGANAVWFERGWKFGYYEDQLKRYEAAQNGEKPWDEQDDISSSFSTQNSSPPEQTTVEQRLTPTPLVFEPKEECTTNTNTYTTRTLLV
jgi:hypothetical protein